jgi:hypothetical protein
MTHSGYSDKLRATRWLDTLAYRCDGPGLWRIYDITDKPAPVGPQYRSKAELLADLERYGRQFCGEPPLPLADVLEIYPE